MEEYAERTTKFSEDLETLVRQANNHTMTVEEMESVLQGRGFAAILIILCLPFVQPIPLPGLSVPFGIAIILMGLRIALGQAAHLPAMVKKREIHTEKLKKLLLGTARIFRMIEPWFKKRLTFLLERPFKNLLGVTIVISGFALCLPLPPVILFSNSLPAWAIIFCAIGLIECDGLMALLGYLMALATWVYFFLIGETVRYAIQELWQRWF